MPYYFPPKTKKNNNLLSAKNKNAIFAILSAKTKTQIQ